MTLNMNVPINQLCLTIWDPWSAQSNISLIITSTRTNINLVRVIRNKTLKQHFLYLYLLALSLFLLLWLSRSSTSRKSTARHVLITPNDMPVRANSRGELPSTTPSRKALVQVSSAYCHCLPHPQALPLTAETEPPPPLLHSSAMVIACN